MEVSNFPLVAPPLRSGEVEQEVQDQGNLQARARRGGTVGDKCAGPGDAWILGYFTDTWSFSIQDTAYSKKQVSGIRILSADTCTFAQTRPRREKKVDYMYM